LSRLYQWCNSSDTAILRLCNPATVSAMENRSVLVIADELAERSLIARILRSGGHPVELAESAKRALQLAKDQKFEAAIVAMSAQPAGEAIVRDLCGSVAKVIALIDRGKQSVRPDPILFPADALLLRPIDRPQLLASLAELKESSLQLDDAPLAVSFEGYTFDVAGRTFVDRKGSETPLTRSEAQLLATFVRSPKRVLTRDQLRHAIAGRGLEAFDRSVDILVARLRRKIEPDSRAPRFIHTISGAGYKFTASPRSVEPSKRLSGAVGHVKPEADSFSQPSNERPTPTIPPGIAPQFQTERRQVTVLSCGLAKAIALLRENDLEVVQDAVSAFRDTAAEAVACMGGTIVRLAGEEILALFGYPEAHEDDVERAVQTGLNLVACCAEIQRSAAAPIRLQTVITTGPILTSSGQDLIGAPLLIAPRLRIIAPPNALLVTAATRKLVREIFDFEDHIAHEAPDIPEPIVLYRVTGRRPVRTRFESTHREGLTPFVGRQKELEQLRSLWERARADGGQVALICGEAGIGKSRIFQTFLDSVATHRNAIVRCQCSPNNTNSPYHPIIRHLEDVVRFDRQDASDGRIEKLRRTLSVAGPVSSLDLALCAALLSIPTDGLNLPSNLTPQRQRNLTNDALVRYILAIARREPLIVKLADAHWADSSTLELFGRIIASISMARVFVVVSCRPEFFAPWLEHSHVSLLRLNRLERELTRRMVVQVAGEPLSDQACEQIIARTDGVPLFVEELTKAVVELGSHKSAAGDYPDSFSWPLIIPETLTDSLMARLDRAGDAKGVAQIGSAIGREFSYGLLAAVADMPAASLHSALARLAAPELIFVRGEPPDSNYIFKHALVQDAAYATLSGSERRQLHNRIARVLEDKFPETVRAQPELVAHHLARAGRAEEAIDYLQTAAHRAIEQSANAEAISHLTGALSLLQLLAESAKHLRMALRLQTLLVQAMIAMRGYAAPQTREALVRARSLVGDRTDRPEKLVILYGLWAASYVGGSSEQLSAANEFLTEAEQRGDAAALCMAHRAIGTTFVNRGDFPAALPHLQRACALYNPEQHFALRHQYGQDIGAAALCYLSWALWHLGSPDQAAVIACEALQRAEESSHPHTLVYTLAHARCLMSIFRRRPDDLQACADLILSLCAEQAFSHWANFGRVCRGWVAVCRGEFDPGIEQLLAGIAGWQGTGSRLWLPIFQTLKAEAYSKAGRAQAAMHAIEEALEWSKTTGERQALAEVLRLKAHLLRGDGKGEDNEIERLLTTSLNIARGQSARIFELRAARDLAKHWQSQGKHNEAVSLLRLSYDKFTEGFDTEDLREASVLIRNLECVHS